MSIIVAIEFVISIVLMIVVVDGHVIMIVIAVSSIVLRPPLQPERNPRPIRQGLKGDPS